MRFYPPLQSSKVKHLKSGCHVTSLCQGLRRSGLGGVAEVKTLSSGCFGTCRIENKIHMILLNPNIKASMPTTSNYAFPLKTARASRSCFNLILFLKLTTVSSCCFASITSLSIVFAVKSMCASFRLDAIMASGDDASKEVQIE